MYIFTTFLMFIEHGFFLLLLGATSIPNLKFLALANLIYKRVKMHKHFEMLAITGNFQIWESCFKHDFQYFYDRILKTTNLKCQCTVGQKCEYTR